MHLSIYDAAATTAVEEFRSFFEHVKSLRFDDRPDYDYLKRLFRELFFRKGFTYDNLYDWEILNAMSNNPTPPNHPTNPPAATMNTNPVPTSGNGNPKPTTAPVVTSQQSIGQANGLEDSQQLQGGNTMSMTQQMSGFSCK